MLFSGNNFYLHYLILACIISVGGYITNSTTLLIGAMLISPIFSPVIKSKTFGLHVIFSLAMSVSLCVFIGYLSSKLFKLTSKDHTENMITPSLWESQSTNNTMLNYMLPLVIGSALSIADKTNNTTAMVGTGIAISVLPPLVNSGMLINTGDSVKAYKSFKLSIVNLTLGSIGYYVTRNMIK